MIEFQKENQGATYLEISKIRSDRWAVFNQLHLTLIALLYPNHKI
jgi:hypothetical protein